MVAVTGAIEITVRGWDIPVACGAARPVPPGLAAVLLPIAPLLITPGTRPGLFAGPVRLPGPAGPGGQLVTFLGRQPRLPAVPGPAAPKPGTRLRAARGDSAESGWSISAGRQTSGAEPTAPRENRYV